MNLLIGSNGAGKSTFIDLLHRVVRLVVLGEAVESAFPWHMPTRWDSRPTQRIELDIIGGGPTRLRTDPFDRAEGLKASELVTRGILDAK